MFRDLQVNVWFMNSGCVIKILSEGREFGMRGGLYKVRMDDMLLSVNESNMKTRPFIVLGATTCQSV